MNINSLKEANAKCRWVILQNWNSLRRHLSGESNSRLISTFPEKFHFKDGKVRTNSDNLIVQALFTPDAAFTKIKNGSETLFSLPSVGVESAGRLSNQLKELFKRICPVKQLIDKISSR